MTCQNLLRNFFYNERSTKCEKRWLRTFCAFYERKIRLYNVTEHFKLFGGIKTFSFVSLTVFAFLIHEEKRAKRLVETY